MRRTLKVFGVALGMALIFAPLSLAQSTTDSVLRQEITAFECNYTTVETGLGRTHDSTCPLFAPTIEIININKGRPIITGIYDAVHTLVLRVQVGGIWYTFGVDTEFTANGNVWILDLSGGLQFLPAGEHLVVVETEGDDGQTRRGEATFRLSAEDVKDNGSSESPSAGSLVRDAVRISLLPLATLVVFSSWMLLIIIARRRRNREDEWAEYYAIMYSKTPEWSSATSQQEERENTPH